MQFLSPYFTLGRQASCGDPGDIENGFRRGKRYTVGSIVHYICNQGYYISGSSSISCKENGVWSPSPPTCESKLLLLWRAIVYIK